MKKKKTLEAYKKNWNKFISFDVKKKVKCKTSHGKSKEKNEFGSP
jgi:hypothetical protein